MDIDGGSIILAPHTWSETGLVSVAQQWCKIWGDEKSRHSKTFLSRGIQIFDGGFGGFQTLISVTEGFYHFGCKLLNKSQ